ncbi:YtxH domain-containing protein [Niallia sp.]|uniref:YtxH domain-containing protein n=1 Tax=Niallia sp. TaxID=2837523 RepID=UPI0028A28F04|nr:YtxH domain-containing protein [Niallia sp.]
MSNATKQSNKILTGLVIGSVIGVTISLIDPATRRRTMQRVEHFKDTSTRFVQSYKDNPDEFKSNCKERISLSSEAMKDIAAETQGLYKQVQSTVKERSKDLKEITDDFKQLYFQTKHQYKRITKKITTTKDQIIESSDLEEKSQLPAAPEDKEVMKTDTVLL